MLRRMSRLYKYAKKTKQLGTFQKECKKVFKKAAIDHNSGIIQKCTDEKKAQNRFGDTSSLDVKILLVNGQCTHQRTQLGKY